MATLTLTDGERGGDWDALIGRTVGSYRIVRLLGRGGMGAVYLARQPAIGAQVAIKFLHPRFSADRSVVERFFNEARAVNLIGHENILKILDFSVTPEGRYFFVMEFLEGKPLASLTEQKQPQQLPSTGPILLQCCRALQAAHGRGIVHRDLKPDNVFLVQQMGRKNFVKLVDFGIAKLEEAPYDGGGGDGGRPGLTAVGTVIGTPEYMSPEQAAGRTAEVGRRSDVYSLGIVMYQLACGRVPFSGASTAQTLVAQMETPPPAPRSLVPDIPAAYEALILKALAKRREDRFQSMQELHGALLEVMKGLGISAELPFADEAPALVVLPPEGTPDEQIDTLLGPPPEARPPHSPKTAPERPSAREIDPRFATQPPPATQTAVQPQLAPVAQAARAGDYIFAPHRRSTLVGLSAVVLVVLVGLALRPRGAGPPPAQTPEVPAQPAAQPLLQHPSTPAPKRPESAREVKVEPPALRPSSPAQLAVAAQEKARQHKAAQKALEEAKRAPAVPAPPAIGPAQKPAVPAKGTLPAVPRQVTESLPKPAQPSAKEGAPSRAVQPKAPPLKPPRAKAPADLVAQATKEMTAAAEAAVLAEAAEKPAPHSAKLFLVSDPPGAQVTAAWAGKSASGEAPVVFRVLRGAKVTVTFSLPGHAPDVKAVEAGKSQVVVGVLKVVQ